MFTHLILGNVIQSAFSPLIDLFAAILVFLHKNIVGGSWGLAIVGLTILVRAVLLPLTITQFRSMQAMQRLAPQMNAIKEKYKEDKQRQQEEMMKFYKENGVNPFASCLPLVLQFPVLISLFYALRSNLKEDICGTQLVDKYNQLHPHIAPAITKASQLPSSFITSTSCNSVAPHSAKFLFIPDITAQATGAVLVVLLLLYVGTQLGSSLMMSSAAPANQRWMMLALPLVFVAFIFRFPAGVLVYWITTNIWTLGQQYIMRRRMPPPPPAPPPTTTTRARPEAKPALAAVGAGAGRSGGGAPPPRPPRRKKKRSGRRR